MEGSSNKAVYGHNNTHLSAFGYTSNLTINANCLSKGGDSTFVSETFKPEDYLGLSKDKFLAGEKKFGIVEVEVYTVDCWKNDWFYIDKYFW